MLYIISTVEAYIMEDEGDNKYLQMDETMKKLFTLKEKRPIIDFLNAAYGDDLSYEIEINYNNTEIINTKGFSSTYMTFHADMFITAVEGDKILEYAIEFQTKFDEEILIRMFRYSFERAAKLVYFKDKNKLRLKLPEPYLIILEKEKGIDNEITLEIEIPKALPINFKVKVLKSYLLNKYELKDDVDKEVKIMFKGFYDPKIEAI